MKRPALCFAGVSALLVPQYSCHPGTRQENYAASRHCFATLNANLAIQSADRFRQAGLNRDAVVVASDGNMNAAYDLGKLLGMSPAAVFKDIEGAKAAYTKSHTE